MKICDFLLLLDLLYLFFIGIYYESALKAKNKEIDYELTLFYDKSCLPTFFFFHWMCRFVIQI